MPAVCRSWSTLRSATSSRSAGCRKTSSSPTRSPPPPTWRRDSELQRAQEVQNVLLLALPEVVEVSHHRIRFGAIAAVRLDRHREVGGPPVMQEEDALSQSPQRRGAELPRTGLPLRDAVGQPHAHVVQQQVGKEIDLLTPQRRDGRAAGIE